MTAARKKDPKKGEKKEKTEKINQIKDLMESSHMNTDTRLMELAQYCKKKKCK